MEFSKLIKIVTQRKHLWENITTHSKANITLMPAKETFYDPS